MTAPPVMAPTRRVVPADLWLLGAFVVVAVLMTFPHVGRLTSHVAGDNGDAMLNLWTLRWVAHAWSDGWSALWDGQTFQPNSNTLAWSESMLPMGLLFGVLRFVVRDDVLAYNLITLAAWTGSLWWSYRLMLRFVPRRLPAVVGALTWTFAAVRLGQLLHFQLGMACFVPLVLLCLFRYLEEPRVSVGLGLGASLALVTLTASYYGVTMVLAVAMVVPAWFIVRRRLPDRTFLVRLIPGVVVACLLVLPVAARYVELQRDPAFRRTPEQQFAASREDFLAVAGGNRLLADLPPFRDHPAVNSERQLFPGIVAIVLGTTGAVVLVVEARRRRRARSADSSEHDPAAEDAAVEDAAADPTDSVGPTGERLRELLLLVGVGVVFLVLSAGDEISVAGHQVTMPYRWLREVVPALDGVRATARFVVLPQLALAALATVGAAAAVRRLGHRAATVALVLVCGAVLAETTIETVEVRVPDDAAWTAVNHELADRPPGLVLELPIRDSSDLAVWPYTEAPRQYLATIDWQPRVNGYSGFDRPDGHELATTLDSFPSPQALAAADALGVRYVVIRTEPVGYLPDDLAELLATDGVAIWDTDLVEPRLAGLPSDRVASIEQYGAAWLVELTPPPEPASS